MAAPSGTKWGSIVGDYGKIGLYTNVSTTNTTASVTVEIWFASKYSVSDSGNTLYYDAGSTSISSATTDRGSVSISTTSDSGSGWSSTNEVKLKTYTYDYNRGTSEIKRYLAAKLADVDRVGGTMSATSSFTVPALTSYTISYNANGGSGAPSSQTKYYGKDLTLSSTKPTRTGYTFKGWSTSSTATTATYSAGDSYTANSAATLYAVWQEHKLTVNYYSNYATESFADALNPVGADKNVIVRTATFYYDNDATNGHWDYSQSGSSTYLHRTGYTATGYWGTSTSGGTLVSQSTSYSTGQALAEAVGKSLKTGDASVNLYAQWTENVLTVNYYSNYADYGTYKGEALGVSASTNVKVHTQDFLYDNSYSSALSNIQNTSYLYLSRTGYTSTGYWGTSTSGGTLIDEDADYSTGQALAQAFGKSLANGNASVNVYPQWQINTYTIGYDGNGGYGSMDVQLVDWQETFALLDNQFKREGYKFVGWNAQREVDRKWYVNGQGWVTEEEITANSYEKKLYANQDELIFDLSWIKGETGVIHQYTMYAIWEISGVVYIDNGTTFEPYLAYIDNGTEWELYLIYVDDGADWNIIS